MSVEKDSESNKPPIFLISKHPAFMSSSGFCSSNIHPFEVGLKYLL